MISNNPNSRANFYVLKALMMLYDNEAIIYKDMYIAPELFMWLSTSRSAKIVPDKTVKSKYSLVAFNSKWMIGPADAEAQLNENIKNWRSQVND